MWNLRRGDIVLIVVSIVALLPCTVRERALLDLPGTRYLLAIFIINERQLNQIQV